MPVPLIAVAARIGAGAARGAKGMGKRFGKKGLGSGGQEQQKPFAASPEGIIMLALAGILEFVNILIGFLDFAFGIGLPLGPIVNIVGTILIGGWLWMRFRKLPLKKALAPLVLNSIPLLKFFPWWLFSVGTSVSWKSISPPKTQQEKPPSPNTQKTQPVPY